MNYIDGFCAAVPNDNKETYLKYAQISAAIFKEHGALRVVESWADDVPEGKLTSFSIAVQRTETESVVFSWIEWPDKATRDSGWAAVMADSRMAEMDMPFDGKRLIYGGFNMVSEV